MKIRSKTLRAAVIACALLPTAVVAAPNGDEPRDGGKAEWRDEMRHSLGLMFLHRIRTELELTDEQMLKLLPRIEALDEIRRTSHERRRTIAEELELLAESPAATDAAIMELVRALDAEEARARDLQNRERDALLAVLDPQQKARFVLSANRLRQRLEREMRKPRGAGRGGPPGDEPANRRKRMRDSR